MITNNCLLPDRNPSWDAIALMEDNLYSYILLTNRRRKSVAVFNIDYLLAFSTGLVCRARFKSDEQEVKAVIDLVKKYLNNTCCTWWINPTATPPNLAALLENCGFKPGSAETGMVLNLKDFKCPPASCDDFSLTMVDSAVSFNDYIQVVAQYWDIPNTNHIQEAYVESRETLLDPAYPLKLYVGYHRGEPVTSSELFLRDGIAGIYAVTTVKKRRRQGFASKLMSSLLTYGAQHGWDTAVLQSTAHGKKLYSCLGFKDLCTFSEYKFRNKAST